MRNLIDHASRDKMLGERLHVAVQIEGQRGIALRSPSSGLCVVVDLSGVVSAHQNAVSREHATGAMHARGAVYQDGLPVSHGTCNRGYGADVIFDFSGPVAPKRLLHSLDAERFAGPYFRELVGIVRFRAGQIDHHANPMASQGPSHQGLRKSRATEDFALFHGGPSLGDPAILNMPLPSKNGAGQTDDDRGGKNDPCRAV